MTRTHIGAAHGRARRRSLLEIQLARVQQRRMSSEEMRRYLDALPIAALVADNAGIYVMANPAAARLVGYKVEELRRMSVWDLIPAVKEHETDVLWRNFVRVKAQRGSIKLRTKKGELIAARYVAKAHVLPGLHLSLLSTRR